MPPKIRAKSGNTQAFVDVIVEQRQRQRGPASGADLVFDDRGEQVLKRVRLDADAVGRVRVTEPDQVVAQLIRGPSA